MNLLDAILVSPRTLTRWASTANAVTAHLMIHPDEIGDEDAEILPDGKLRIFCDSIDGERVAEMDVPADEWEWLPTAKN